MLEVSEPSVIVYLCSSDGMVDLAMKNLEAYAQGKHGQVAAILIGWKGRVTGFSS